MRLKLIIITILFFSFSTIIAQSNFTVSGNIQNPKNKPLENATIVLNNFQNEPIYQSNSKANGSFEIKNVTEAIYVLSISMVNYNTYYDTIEVSKNINLFTINLANADKNNLKGVTVVADKPVAKFTVDKKIYNVGQDITAAGGSASDVLKNVPSLTVDPVDGNVAIRGNENILILVDGKPSTLLGTDIATILQSIPANSIESIEVINNPGAKYDAQGKGGALNIVLKKDRKPGYNANIGLNVGLPARANLNIGFNANKNKWNFFGNISGRTSKTFIDERIERENYNDDTTLFTSSYTSRKPLNIFTNIGVDYTYNKYNKFTFSQNAFAANMKGDVTTDIYNAINYNNQNYFVKTNRINEYTGKPRNTTSNFNYTRTFKKEGMDWKTDASLGISNYQRTSDFTTDTFLANNNLFSTNNFQSIPVKGGNNNFTISSDFNLPLNKISKLELGVKMIDFSFRSENFPVFQKDNGPILDATPLKNKFDFKQNTYAAYTNYKLQLKDFSAQIGGRYEHFEYDGFVHQYNQGVQASFDNFFPSLYVNQKINKLSDLTFSYTKRTNRPNFFQLIPYIDVTNPQDTSQGNPNLKPEFIHATELSYNKNFSSKSNIIASIYYQYNNNLIQRFKRFNNNGTTFTQPQNIDNGTTYGAELGGKYFIKPFWDISLNANIFNNIINSQNISEGIKIQGWSGFAKLMSNIKLKKIWDVQLSSNYHAPAVVAQGRTKYYYNVDVAIKRNFFKNAMTVTLSGNDIFNTTYLGSVYDFPNLYKQYNYKKSQTQQITFGVQFRFASKNTNPADVKEKKFNRKGQEIKETKNRDENLKKDERDDENNGGGQNGGQK